MCGLRNKAPEVWRTGVVHALAGGSLTALQDFLKAEGFDVSLDSLSRCRKGHLRRFARTALQLQWAGETLAGLLEKAEPGDLAVRALMEQVLVLQAVATELAIDAAEEAGEPPTRQDREKRLAEVTSPAFKALMGMIRTGAKDLAGAERMRSQSALDTANLSLRSLDVALRTREYQEAGNEAMRQWMGELKMKLSPAARAEVEQAMQELIDERRAEEDAGSEARIA